MNIVAYTCSSFFIKYKVFQLIDFYDLFFECPPILFGLLKLRIKMKLLCFKVYYLSLQNKKLDAKVETAMRLWEKSFMSRGSNQNQAKGMQKSITRNKAGRIRLARRS